MAPWHYRSFDWLDEPARAGPCMDSNPLEKRFWIEEADGLYIYQPVHRIEWNLLANYVA